MYAICQKKKKNDERTKGWFCDLCLVEIEKMIGYFKTAPILTS